MHTLTRDSQKGFTLIEIMIAIVMISIGLMAVAKFQLTALHADKLAREQTEAAMWASNQAEVLIKADFDDDTLDPDNSPHSMDPVGENGKYRVTWDVATAQSDENVKVIQIFVAWDSSGKEKKMNFAYVKSRI